MALFRLFSSKKVANSDVNSVEIKDEQDVNNENVAWVLRKACKAASICKFAADTCEK